MTGGSRDTGPDFSGDGQTGSTEDPQELRDQIERTRADVGDTVEALAGRADVPGRAKRRASDAAERAKAQVSQRSTAARQKGEEFRERFAERVGPHGEHLRDSMPGQAQDMARSAAERARENRTQLAYVAAGLIALLWLLTRRRRHRHD